MRRHSRSLLYRKGWNTALESVARHLSKLPKSLARTASGRLALEAVGTMVKAMAAPPPRYLATNCQLAKRYGTSQRTITNWRREGCPFERGQKAVLKWISWRRYAPAETEQKFKHQLTGGRFCYLVVQMKQCMTEFRLQKELYKLNGLEPDPFYKNFRCPKRSRLLRAQK
jgi:hypothetical protein